MALHVAFIRAGSDVILTNTYGANPVKLAPHKLDDRFEAMNQAGVKLAREAREVAGRDVLVGGSIGPLGAAPGRLSPEQMAEAFSAQAAALEGRGVDLFVLETFTSLEELRIAARAVRAVAGPALIAQVTVGRRRRDRGRSAPPPTSRRRSRSSSPVAVGVNCSLGPQTVLAGLERMRAATDLPLTAQANAGMPNVSTGRLVYPNASPEYFGEYAAHALALGAVVIGGCCGTTPEHVAAIRRAVSERRPPAVALQLVERELPIRAASEARRDAARGASCAGASSWCRSSSTRPRAGTWSA